MAPLADHIRQRGRALRAGLSKRAAGAASAGGWVLVEVLMGAVIVAATATAILGGLDGFQRATTVDRSRSVAMSLAEQDIDRMRGLRNDQLANLDQTRVVTVKGVNYTVRSRADWLSDSGTDAGCTQPNAQANYLRLTSTVSSPALPRPVTLRTLVTPRGTPLDASGGAIVLTVVDRNDQPLPGVTMQLSGPVNLVATTNDQGCVFFAGVPGGDYTVTAPSSYVQMDGSSPPTSVVSPIPGQTVNKTMKMDRPGKIRAQIATKVGGTLFQSQATTLSVANASLPSPNYRTFTIGSPATQITTGDLFPFPSGYGVFTGGCAANNPTVYAANYFQTNPGLGTPGPGDTVDVTVIQPAINVVVKNSSGAVMAGAEVVAYSQDSGCSQTFRKLTNSQGKLNDPGFPFGNYRICADNNQSGSSARYAYASGTIANTSPDGTATITITVPSSTSARGRCP
ncbi:carboxypeptidase-like regulatory domain-containing protein [Thermoleophilum album]|uniref:Type II secretory pathway, pseudopilin PulG n=1 Tax=Thermoleophilum album TaxID=29539 RepID=A0A1H6FS22_THEAL|nr:carboxypeptidase-like regulatory domain-containing protein [Thermoleophilum album]SEH13701.1 Type II secretory pathway, pseudopilin PulG [Thermoleophilum album]